MTDACEVETQAVSVQYYYDHYGRYCGGGWVSVGGEAGRKSVIGCESGEKVRG